MILYLLIFFKSPMLNIDRSITDIILCIRYLLYSQKPGNVISPSVPMATSGLKSAKITSAHSSFTIYIYI